MKTEKVAHLWFVSYHLVYGDGSEGVIWNSLPFDTYDKAYRFMLKVKREKPHVVASVNRR